MAIPPLNLSGLGGGDAVAQSDPYSQSSANIGTGWTVSTGSSRAGGAAGDPTTILVVAALALATVVLITSRTGRT